MNQQITKIAVKKLQTSFEWIIQDLWSYEWEMGQFLLSDDVKLEEVYIKSWV